jgi:hypothetical protein
MATITITWPDDNLMQDVEDAALYLNYQDEIIDSGTGELIPNPVSKVRTIKESLLNYLQQLVISGAAMQAEIDRQQYTAIAKLRTDEITID